MVYLLKGYVKTLDSDALLVYTALRSMYHKNDEIMYVSINQICYQLCGNINYTRTFRDCVVSGFDKLCESKIVTIKDSINKTEFVLDLSGLFFEKQYFIEIDLEYVRKVCNCPSRVDKCSLLKYLLTMVGTFSHKEFDSMYLRHKTGFVGFMAISYIAKEAGISEQVALSYNTVLEQNEIIFIYRHGHYYQDEDGNLKTVNNQYGLFHEKANIIMFGDNYDEFLGFESLTKVKNRENGNHNRSLAAKYRSMCAGVQYGEEETREIYEYIHEQNAKLQANIDKKVYKWEDLVEKLRDESVFEGVI